MKRADALLGGSTVAGLAAVGAALVSQQMFGIQPCPWCVFQRLLFVLVAAGALVGLVWRSPLGRRVGAALALVFALGGVAAALYQHFVAAATNTCNVSLAEKIIAALGLDASLPDVFMATASCADAAVKLVGVPYEFWSLALFALIALAMASVLRRGR
ncbi:MAG: disulfide bond formation protein B [Burkholderiales bacterium]|nr:disulfide bond formation protein B [Burkholderiales bacterium]MDE2453759.1 disulfide bond formation protein B [Burkholderiales bacterium]